MKLTAIILTGILGLAAAPELSAQGRNYRSGSRGGVSIRISTGHRRSYTKTRSSRSIRAVPRTTYKYVNEWVAGHYETREEQVWVPGWDETVYEDLWIEGRYEERIEYVWDTGRRVAKSVRVWVPGYTERVQRVVRRPGYYKTLYTQVWVPGCFVSRRVIVYR